MDDVFRSYINPGFRYVHYRAPARVSSRADALTGGLNCVALAHLVIRDLFDYRLPPDFQSTELSSDFVHFKPVATADQMDAGDLVWLGMANPAVAIEDFEPQFKDGELTNFKEFPINHVAIYTGDKENDDYLLLHASSVDGTNAIWPLKKFEDYDRYRVVYAIRRLREQFRGAG